MKSQLDRLRPRGLVGSHTDNRFAPSQTMTVADGNETDSSERALETGIDISISLHPEAAVRQTKVEDAACTHGTQSRACYEHEDETDSLRR
jgi:hypothetical protein